MSNIGLSCPHCGSKDIEFHESAGHAACVECGTLLEENTIVSSIEFQESGDRSHVIGQFVSVNNANKPSTRNRGRYGFSRDSRDATLQNARRIILQVASGLRLPSYYVERAYRLYSLGLKYLNTCSTCYSIIFLYLALQRNFLYGRRQMHVVATVLYTICRQEKSPHLLIDFSDALQVNVFKLGQSYLQFTRMLSLTLPIIDPSLFIHRFASQLGNMNVSDLFFFNPIIFIYRARRKIKCCFHDCFENCH
jgi:transcription factor IIIB subunit 2